jgi:predicted nuclease of predicted toxin-antitoxin system
VKLLLDEQISDKIAERLRVAGTDVIAVTVEPSLRGLSDPDLFEVAQSQGRTLVTYNRADFEAIVGEYAEAGQEHHGLVIIHPTRFPNQQLARLVKALDRLNEAPSPGRSFIVWLQDG